MSLISLDNVPKGTKIMWSSLSHNDRENWDEDLVWAVLPTNIGIDVGNYGRDGERLYRVCVIDEPEDGWIVHESSYCRTPQETYEEIGRLANKYNDPWYAKLCHEICDHRRTYGDFHDLGNEKDL